MSEPGPANVLAAYELLLEEVESEIDWVNRSGSAAFAVGDHEHAAQVLDRARALADVRRDLLAFGQRLRALVKPQAGGAPEARARLAKGLKTPEAAYRVPILRALVELDGSAKMNTVLGRVYQVMKPQLNEHDLAPMPSDEHCPRWRNTAQWCRNTLREEGLLKGDSPHGVWEISEAGRRWLATRSKEVES